MSSPDIRHEVVKITDVFLDSRDGTQRFSSAIEPGKAKDSDKIPSRVSTSFKIPFVSDRVKAIEYKTEQTLSVILTPEPQTVIERLRSEHPGRNIVAVGIELEDTSEMKDFFFQFAHELETSPHSIPEVKHHPFDSAKGQIIRMANHNDKKAAKRWGEFFSTGTLQNPPDHSLDWIYATRRKPQVGGSQVIEDRIGKAREDTLRRVRKSTKRRQDGLAESQKRLEQYGLLPQTSTPEPIPGIWKAREMRVR